ncbi:hypothetical protein ACVIIV_003202 [Bradyrhizobium sp. USDA 4354]
MPYGPSTPSPPSARPARSSQAREAASRRFVFTRLPDFLGIGDAATTVDLWPSDRIKRKGHSQLDRPHNKNAQHPTGWRSVQRPRACRSPTLDLTEEASLYFLARFRDRIGVFQLCDVNSNKYFPIICLGSSSCDENRLGTPSNPRTRSVGRAISPEGADIRSYDLSFLEILRSYLHGFAPMAEPLTEILQEGATRNAERAG